MNRTFDPDTNPYADDLLRLSFAPPERYSHAERRNMARIIAGKLYKLTLEEPFHTDLGFGSWYSKNAKGRQVEIDVIFDRDPLPRLSVPDRHYRHGFPLIVLNVGKSGVVEVFNGLFDQSRVAQLERAIRRVRDGGEVEVSDEAESIGRRHDAEAAEDYRGNLPPGGGGGGGDAPGDVPGSGGVGELVDHPVLFSVETHIFDSILEEV